MTCNCGRKGTPREGCCIYCKEHDPDWRMWVAVQRIIAEAKRAALKPLT
jgi:hypothetical protein